MTKATGTPIQGLLLLCAPALQLDPPSGFAGPLSLPAPTIIIHGTRDEVIPISVSHTFAEQHGVRLVEVDDDHSLASSLDTIAALARELSPS